MTQLAQTTDAIADMFARAKSENRAAFLPYFPIGFPTYDESLATIQALAEIGADGFEIGIPFSDPLADGPVNQAAMQRSLENGTTVHDCLNAVAELRARGVQQPMMLMGYVNPVLAYGAEKFVQDAKKAGANGLIIPDLPVDEGAFLAEVCRREGMALVFFLAPTSQDARIEQVARQASGFIYVVSLTGVTGERTRLPADLSAFIARVRAHVGNVPLVMGFGISTPEHARMMNGLVDGYAVGTAIVRAGGQGIEAVRELATRLRQA